MEKSIHSIAYKQIISLLRSKREKANITQKQLADSLGVNQAVISKIEICERRLDIVELKSICDKINVDFIEFCAESLKLIENYNEKHSNQ